jgi:hypothetical protein
LNEHWAVAGAAIAAAGLSAEIAVGTFAHIGRQFGDQKVALGVHYPVGPELRTFSLHTPHALTHDLFEKCVHLIGIVEVDGFKSQRSRDGHVLSCLEFTGFDRPASGRIQNLNSQPLADGGEGSLNLIEL